MYRSHTIRISTTSFSFTFYPRNFLLASPKLIPFLISTNILASASTCLPATSTTSATLSLGTTTTPFKSPTRTSPGRIVIS